MACDSAVASAGKVHAAATKCSFPHTSCVLNMEAGTAPISNVLPLTHAAVCYGNRNSGAASLTTWDKNTIEVPGMSHRIVCH